MTAPPLVQRGPRRRVVLSVDYLAGVQMADVRPPCEFDETYRLVDAAAIDVFVAAWATLCAAEVVLVEAYGTAPERPNPKYRADDTQEGAS